MGRFFGSIPESRPKSRGPSPCLRTCHGWSTSTRLFLETTNQSPGPDRPGPLDPPLLKTFASCYYDHRCLHIRSSHGSLSLTWSLRSRSSSRSFRHSSGLRSHGRCPWTQAPTCTRLWTFFSGSRRYRICYAPSLFSSDSSCHKYRHRLSHPSQSYRLFGWSPETTPSHVPTEEPLFPYSNRPESLIRTQTHPHYLTVAKRVLVL